MVEVHGHAARADSARCATSLNAAERADTKCPAWLDYFDDAYLSAKTAHCFQDLGDHTRTARFAEQSLAMADGHAGRTFNLCLLASARAEEDPRDAVRIGNEALGIAARLESRRSLAYLRELRHRLTPHAGLPEVADFRQRVLEAATPRAD